MFGAAHPPKSPGLKTHGDSQRVVQNVFFAIAMAFWITAKCTDTPCMPVEVYGPFVVGLPAEVWAASLMLASFLYLIGIRINGAWRHSPVLRLAGAAWHTLTLGIFVWSSAGQPYADFFTLSCAIFGGLHGWFCWLNFTDAARGYGWLRNDR